MKRKNLTLGIVAAMGLFVASCSQSGQKQTETSLDDNTDTKISSVKINAGQSKIVWEGEMLGVYKHEGTLNFTLAELSMKDGKITGGNFITDLKTITPTDENYNPEEGTTPEKLVGHLSSADFFDVESFPTAKFEITAVEGNEAMGLLTIRGITNEEKVENISISKDGDNVNVSGELVFDRKKYDMIWDSPMKEMILSNDVKLSIELIGS